MTTATIDRILEDMLQVLPVFHKKLLRMDLGGATGNLTRLHLGIMRMLRDGSMTASDLARLSAVPKSQMTHLLDQLSELRIVERRPDADDRRVIHLVLTGEGRVLLQDVKHRVQENIRNRLAALTPEELATMAEALETLRMIGARL